MKMIPRRSALSRLAALAAGAGLTAAVVPIAGTPAEAAPLSARPPHARLSDPDLADWEIIGTGVIDGHPWTRTEAFQGLGDVAIIPAPARAAREQEAALKALGDALDALRPVIGDAQADALLDLGWDIMITTEHAVQAAVLVGLGQARGCRASVFALDGRLPAWSPLGGRDDDAT